MRMISNVVTDVSKRDKEMFSRLAPSYQDRLLGEAYDRFVACAYPEEVCDTIYFDCTIHCDFTGDAMTVRMVAYVEGTL